MRCYGVGVGADSSIISPHRLRGENVRNSATYRGHSYVDCRHEGLVVDLRDRGVIGPDE